MSRNNPKVIRRRPSRQQGRALEVLGHAIEYLIDSDLHADPSAPAGTNQQAADVLMRLSREVFAQCPQILPERRSLKSRILRLLDPNHAEAASGDLLR